MQADGPVLRSVPPRNDFRRSRPRHLQSTGATPRSRQAKHRHLRRRPRNPHRQRKRPHLPGRTGTPALLSKHRRPSKRHRLPESRRADSCCRRAPKATW